MSSSGFSNLNKYVENIMELLIRSDKIVRLLSDVEPDMYSDRKLPMANPKELLDKNIMPYAYVPEIQTEVNSYINISFDKFKLSHGQTLKDGFLIFEAICHTQLDKTLYGYRHLLLCSEIDNIFNKKDIGVGDLEFCVGEKIQQSNNLYTGYRLVYRIRDFN